MMSVVVRTSPCCALAGKPDKKPHRVTAAISPVKLVHFGVFGMDNPLGTETKNGETGHLGLSQQVPALYFISVSDDYGACSPRHYSWPVAPKGNTDRRHALQPDAKNLTPSHPATSVPMYPSGGFGRVASLFSPNLKRLFRYVLPYGFRLGVGVIMVAFVAFAEGLVALMIRPAVDFVLNPTIVTSNLPLVT